MTLEKQKESELFYIMRGFAILSVAFAHSLSLQTQFFSRVGALVGLLGVPIFLICSGYYWRPSELNRAFLIGKFKSIVVPWLIWGSFAFLLSLFLTGSKETGSKVFISYFLFLFGYGTWLYYVPVYLVLIFVFQLIRPSKSIIITSVIVSLFSNVISFYLHPQIGITPYQNPFNWIGFYAIGVFLKGKIDLLIRYRLGLLIFAALSAVSVGLLIVLAKWKICYWHPLSLLFELLTFWVLLLLAVGIKWRFFIIIGKNSYILYFLHMQLGIALANRLFLFIGLQSELVELLFKPLVVILITIVIVFLLTFFLRFIGCARYCNYLGIRI